MANRNVVDSINSKVRALKCESFGQVDQLGQVNPFLASLLREIAVDRHNGNRLGFHGVVEVVTLLRLTGLDGVLVSPEAVDSHPEAFWELMEAAKHRDLVAVVPRGVEAVRRLYVNLDNRGCLGEAFRSHPKSPHEVLRTMPFKDFLRERFVCAEDTFLVTYSRHAHPQFLNLHFERRELGEMVVDAFLRCLNKNDRRGRSLDVLYEVESWFVDCGPIRSYRDLDGTVLSNAIRYIMSHYEGRTRKEYMCFLFHVFSIQLLDHPEYDFFRASHIWSTPIVLDRRIPLHLAAGYRFAVFGQVNDLHQDGGVLMVVKDGRTLSANGRVNMVFRFDLSSITNPVYWRAFSRYIIQYAFMELSDLRQFLVWLQEWKASSGTDPAVLTSVDTAEYRVLLSRKRISGSSRNCTLSRILKFLRWADGEGLLTVMPGALSALQKFETFHRMDPSPVSTEELGRLRACLLELGKEFPRYLLVEKITHLLVKCDVRVGQLCAINLDSLLERPDGTIDYYSKRKNSGSDFYHYLFPKGCSDILREVMAMTEEVRRACPVGGFDKHLFVYREAACSQMPFGLLTTNKVGMDLRYASKVAGLRDISTGNLRDTYMSAAMGFARKHNLNDLQRMLLTKHANRYSTKSYTKIYLDDLLIYGERAVLGEINKINSIQTEDEKPA